MIERYPYRFKTELEMKTQYGKNWRKTSFPGYGWNYQMDYLFGIDYPYFISTTIPKSTLRDMDQWSISWDMLIKKVIEPTYKSKKILRTL